jgi:hypothetical protein
LREEMGFGNWWRHRSGMAKTVVALAATLCLGVGLCALDFQLGAHGFGRTQGNGISVGPLDGVSLIVMIGSLLGLAITLILWLVTFLLRSVSGR